MSPVTVNVYSDASIAPGGSAWGAVIVRPGVGPREASGRFRFAPRSSTEAELRAAANAVHAGLIRGLIKPGDRVVIRCDNAVAVQWIEGAEFRKRKTNRRRDLGDPARYIRETAIERGFEVAGLWVRGHQRQDAECPHAQFNRRADQLCGLLTQTAKVRKSRSRPPRKERERLKRAADKLAEEAQA